MKWRKTRRVFTGYDSVTDVPSECRKCKAVGRMRIQHGDLQAHNSSQKHSLGHCRSRPASRAVAASTHKLETSLERKPSSIHGLQRRARRTTQTVLTAWRYKSGRFAITSDKASCVAHFVDGTTLCLAEPSDLRTGDFSHEALGHSGSLIGAPRRAWA